MRRFVALGLVVAAAFAGCSEQPKAKSAPAPMDRMTDEIQKAAEALVHAARHVAGKAGHQAQEAADAARNAVDALASSGGSSGAAEAPWKAIDPPGKAP